ncbi:uncharacterized protein DUF998 [Asanoa ferruginea]|uniref:Uncharacterized protein DUF998 n=1 Tax=Asanoa ferruginea TaxID=53367 RepID=A0A3D9ZWF0_9ACTN|nr:DUF998 domain-containing protein [Asanoa ferruginea]REG01472.1 uncharacterized protein DUF998 [Asanoa ferruginea]GIF47901.1 hypothetical protein Afe04nite_24400 [Asanoa ferruginea]
MSTVATTSRTTRHLLSGGLVAPLFVLVMLVDGIVQPGYRSLHHYGSELSLGRFGWIQIANFLITGLALCAFAVGLRGAIPSGPGSRSAPVLAGICGVGLLVAGIFSTDPTPGYPVGGIVPEHPTLHGQIHGYAPMAVFLSLAALIFVMARRFAKDPALRVWMWCSIAAGILVPATFIASAALYDFATQTGHYHGLFQRISLAIGFGWLGALALHLRGERPLRG